jgi:hypothetical protein
MYLQNIMTSLHYKSTLHDNYMIRIYAIQISNKALVKVSWLYILFKMASINGPKKH